MIGHLPARPPARAPACPPPCAPPGGKVRAELGAERRAHLELMRAMQAGDESRRKERDEVR